MRRPPRPSGESLFGSAQISLAVVQGLVLLAAVLGLYYFLTGSGGDPAPARTAAFVALVSGHLSLAASMLAGRGHSLVGPHRWMFWLILTAASFLITLTLIVPALIEIMRFARPSPETLIGGLALGIAAGGWYSARLLVPSRLGGALRGFAYGLQHSAA